MKVLFINPSQENFLNAQIGWTFGLKDVGYYQPLGILYVATYLKTHNPDVEVKVIDAASPDMPYPELENKIKEFNPDVIGISTYTHTFIDTLKIAAIAKKINYKIHINCGGYHLKYYAKETLTHKIIDSIIIGEGEVKFSRLIEDLRKGNRIENIDGVFTRDNIYEVDKYESSKQFLSVSEIHNLTYPDRKLLNGFTYYNALTIDKKMTTIISSRGCPFNCTFCPQGREPYRQRSSKDVVDEIEYCMKQGYTDFFFAEDTFNINKKKIVDFCNEILTRDLKVGWCCKARIAGFDYETLKLMSDAGCYLINFGVETGTDEGLRLLQKGTTTNEIRQVFDWCKNVKIKTVAYFMIGQPFEKTKEEIKNNVKFLISLDADYCNINTVNPTPFTPLYDDGVKKGILIRTTSG